MEGMGMKQANRPICAVCGDPAMRVRHGRDFCSEHEEGDLTPVVPITPCAICGEPAVSKVGGRDMCRYHAEHLAA